MTSSMHSMAVVGRQEIADTVSVIPTVGSDEVLVRVAYCGICGSDVPRFFDGAVHAFPQVLGHEFSGVVDVIGEAVSGIGVGERVTVAPLVPCHSCDQCAQGHLSLCPRYSFIGSRQSGALAEFVVVPAANVVPIGDLDLRVGALIEPLTVAIHAVDRGPDVRGLDVAVLGGGVIGLMSVIVLRDRGARSITVVDIDDWVLEMGLQFGATATVNSEREDVLGHFAEAGAPHVVIETAGAAQTRAQAIEITAKRGTAVYVGTPSRDLTLSPKQFEQILRKEITLTGSWMSYSAPFPGREWQEAPRLLASAATDPAAIITHEFSLTDIASGFSAMRDRSAHRLKVMFRVAGGEMR